MCVLGTELGPLGGQPLLLTPKPSLQALNITFFTFLSQTHEYTFLRIRVLYIFAFIYLYSAVGCCVLLLKSF